MTLAETGAESMTGERIRRVRSYVEGDGTFLLTYGDGLSDIDLDASIAEHNKTGAACTLTAVHPGSRFGSLELDKSGAVARFAEKPQLEETFVNGGFMVCSRDIFSYLEGSPNPVFEQEPLMGMAADGRLHAYRHEGWWQSMDTYRESRLLNELWDSGRAPWKIW